jgi:hypothetical protein
MLGMPAPARTTDPAPGPRFVNLVEKAGGHVDQGRQSIRHRGEHVALAWTAPVEWPVVLPAAEHPRHYLGVDRRAEPRTVGVEGRRSSESAGATVARGVDRGVLLVRLVGRLRRRLRGVRRRG